MAPIPHYQYEDKRNFLYFLSTDRQHILNTFEHIQRQGYNGHVPSLDQIAEDNHPIALNVQSGMCDPDQKLILNITPNIRLTINANSVAHVRYIASVTDPDTLRREQRLGDLNADLWHMFLPVYFWEALKSYDFNQHKTILDEWLGDLQDRMNDLLAERVIRRPRTIIVPIVPTEN